eukprot:4066208-Lingulodinium_polyedra.AAC.1
MKQEGYVVLYMGDPLDGICSQSIGDCEVKKLVDVNGVFLVEFVGRLILYLSMEPCQVVMIFRPSQALLRCGGTVHALVVVTEFSVPSVQAAQGWGASG